MQKQNVCVCVRVWHGLFITVCVCMCVCVCARACLEQGLVWIKKNKKVPGNNNGFCACRESCVVRGEKPGKNTQETLGLTRIDRRA